MITFANENAIVSYFQDIDTEDVLFLTESEEAINIYNCIADEESWKKWTNSSNKSDPPPDFFSEHFMLMMEVMRVDDHSHVSEKGKLINPTYARESEILKDLKKSGVLDRMSKDVNIVINAVTDLPTEEDHNYNYYLENFKRVIEKHRQSITLYRKNHNNKRLIFFIFDESSAYCQVDKKTDLKNLPRDGMKCMPHFFFLDKEFIECIKQCKIDNLIWFAPYKHIITETGKFDFPLAIIYDMKYINEMQCIEYDKEKMLSAEE